MSPESPITGQEVVEQAFIFERLGTAGGSWNWRRAMLFAVPLAAVDVLILAFVWLESQREPDWRHELDDYIARTALPSETVTVQSVVRASQPQNFRAEMGRAARYDWRWSATSPSFPAQAVQCVLLERQWTASAEGEDRPAPQILFVAHHSDALYRVGWLVYAGPEEPLTDETAGYLTAIGCDLGPE
jgi:hypothetical protein